MEDNIKSTPKDVFMHLLSIITLYVSIVSLIALSFAYIESIFPDRLNYYFQGILSQIRWSSSVLLVVFPVYILVSWLIAKDVRILPERRHIKIRKWLVYFTLFLSAITVIVDLIALIYRFYSGEIALQFSMKVLSVLIVSASVFGYYFWDLKWWTLESKKPKIFGWVSSGVVLALIVAGFFIVGSPSTQRNRRFDEQRINDLQSIQYQIVYNYWTKKNRLPTSLNDLNDDISGFIIPIDPVTDETYGYKVKSQYLFDLCATFKTNNKYTGSSNNFESPRLKMSSPFPGKIENNWEHGSGEVCFSRNIDPELYRTEKPLPVY